MPKTGNHQGLHELIEDVHYFIPSSLHERSGSEVRRSRARRRARMSRISLTYQELLDRMQSRLGERHMPKSTSFGNLVSALKAYLKASAFTLEFPVGSELRAGYYKARDGYVAQLNRRSPCPSKQYVSNWKSMFRTWHLFVLVLDREAAGRDRTRTPLQQALRSLFRGKVRVKTTAINAGVPHATLKRWLDGARPRLGCERLLKRLESYFRMKRGSLVDLAPRAVSGAVEEAPPESDYCRRLKEQVADPYRVPIGDISASGRKEFIGWVIYKTDGAGSGNRILRTTPRGNRPWGLRKIEFVASPNDWVDKVRGKHCATAGIHFGTVSSFWGFLKREKSKGGLGLSAGKAQTLAHFVNIEKVSAWLDWRVERSGGIRGQNVGRLLMHVSTLCNPNHGYLVSRPGIGRKAGICSAKKWKERCKLAYDSYRSALKDLPKKPQKSRDPFEPIASILALDDPTTAVLDAARRMDADRPTKGGKQEAIWARSRLLLALLASHGLRARNMKELTYRKDNTGQLRQDPDGAWRIVIDKQCFKNEKGAASDRDYNSVVPKKVWVYITQWLSRHRQFLARTDSDLVFVCANKQGAIWKGLNRTFERLSRRYFQNCSGTGPHCMRHIMATAIIKKGGDEGIQKAALFLHDREETVREFYGHLRCEDGTRARDRLLGDFFDKL